jgi:hypothetical protein
MLGLWWIRYAVGAAAGAIAAALVFAALNFLVWLPAAREEGGDRKVAEQAVQSQKEELERKGDDAKLQRLSDYNLCVGYLGRVPECDSLRLQPVREE